MARFGFIGPSYTSQSRSADSEFTMNLYPEIIESPGGKSAMALYGTPGLAIVNAVNGAPSVPNLFAFNGRLFGVAATTFFEINQQAGGGFSLIGRGNLGQLVTNPVSIAANQNQLLIAAGGLLYVFNLATNALTALPPSTLPGPVNQIAYGDGFFLALIAGTNQFFESNPLDGTTWNALATAKVSVFPDNVLAMLPLLRQMIFFGSKQTAIYQNTGDFPLAYDLPIPGAFLEQGIIAPYSAVVMDNSAVWLGGDARGAGIVWRLNGYTPQRISTHALEYAMQGYKTITDAIAYSYQDQGHTFYVLYFPTANATWVYDAATQMWHQRGWWNGPYFNAHRSQCHAYCFGTHFVGDPLSGAVYSMSINTYSDTLASPVNNSITTWPIVRKRRSPIISSENKWIYHQELVLDVETGLGPQPPLLNGAGEPRGPTASLRWSDDSAHTWSNWHDRDCGQAGKYKQRVKWNRTGRSRNRVYELSVSDPVAWRLIEAYVTASPGFEPSERLTKQFQKVT